MSAEGHPQLTKEIKEIYYAVRKTIIIWLTFSVYRNRDYTPCLKNPHLWLAVTLTRMDTF